MSLPPQDLSTMRNQPEHKSPQNSQNNQPKPASLHQYEPQDNEKTEIILTKGQQRFVIRKEFIKFSQLLQMNFQQIDGQKNTSDNPDLQVTVPEGVHISEKTIKIVERFMSECNYNPTSLKLKKLRSNFTLLQKSKLNSDISQFMLDILQPLSSQQIKHLLSFCNYFLSNSLLWVIHYFLASKYSCPFSLKSSSQLLVKYNIQNLTSKQVTKMKKKYLNFFKKIGRELKEIQQDEQQ